MQITFLIGNGFDIGLGLKTRYTEFYKEYIRLAPNDSENIIKFKQELMKFQTSPQSQIIDWSDFESAFGKYSTMFTAATQDQYIECFENFVENFNEYVWREEEKVDYSDEKRIISVLLKAFTEYYRVLDPADIRTINSIFKQYKDNRTINFVSFNYTKTIDRLKSIVAKSWNSQVRSIGRTIHVHGTLEENMIMGVNDASQIKNAELAAIKSICNEIIKPSQNADVGTEYQIITKELIENSHVICIYGMSIGATDKLWWNLIAEWLCADSNRLLIIFANSTDYNKKYTFKKTKPRNMIKNRFFSMLTNGTKLRPIIENRIFVAMNRNIFEMNLCGQKVAENANAANATTVGL